MRNRGDRPVIDSDPQTAKRRVANHILKQEPTITPAAFAGRMAKYAGVSPDTATSMYSELNDDPDADIDTDREIDSTEIENHYNRVAPIYENLGTMDRTLYAIGNQDFTGWYKSRHTSGQWGYEGRPWVLGKEFDDMRDGLDRVVYATINYTPGSFFMDAWDSYEWEEPQTPSGKPSRNWRNDDSPTPEYHNIAAYAPFADIDLVDDIKHQRPDTIRGDDMDVPQAAIEVAIDQYVDAFAELAGGHEHVFALDSVGGAYVMIAPSSVMPIAREFGDLDLTMLFDDMTDRLNDWLIDTRDTVNDRVPAMIDAFEPDELNNKNRLYKAPLSIHSSLDGVVTPLDATADGSADYSLTHLRAVDDALIDRTDEWATGFTSDHEDAVDPIVAGLWPEYHDDADGWTEALQDRLEDLQSNDHHAGAGGEGAQSQTPDINVEEIPDDLETTDDYQVVTACAEAINVDDLARDLSDDWDTDPGRDPPRFAAPWRTSHNSGTAAFADRDSFTDTGEGSASGGAIKFIARERGIISDCRKKVRGDDFWRAINALRQEGYQIPYYEGPNGKHDDVLRLFEDPDDKDEQKKQLARRLFRD